MTITFLFNDLHSAIALQTDAPPERCPEARARRCNLHLVYSPHFLRSGAIGRVAAGHNMLIDLQFINAPHIFMHRIKSVELWGPKPPVYSSTPVRRWGVRQARS